MQIVEQTETEPRLHFIDPKRIKEYWPQLREHIVSFSQGESWLPEDAYMEIVAGRSALYVGDDGGYLIVSVVDDLGGRRMWIWFAYGPAMGAAYMPLVEQLSVAAQCTRIEFSTPFEFWAEHAPRMGFVKTRTIYSKEVGL